MKRKWPILLLLCFLALGLSGCRNNPMLAALVTALNNLAEKGISVTIVDRQEEPKPSEDETFDEGDRTPCQILSYTPYQGPWSGYFPQPGDHVAVIAPSSMPSWGAVNAVVLGLKAWGYVPVEGQHVYTPRSLADCRADLIWALTDPSIKAIFCVTGGYGSTEVMDSIPPETIRNAGKLIIGYSDISVLHGAWTRAGLPSVHASMSRAFTDPWGDWMSAQQQMLKGQLPAYQWEGSAWDIPGSARGVLIGGNLSTLTAMLETSYDPTALEEPFILFLEDVDMDLEQIHRFLTILKHHGVLDRAAGIIFGEWKMIAGESEISDGSSRGGAYASVAEMIRRSFFPEGADIPIAFGFPAGHGAQNYPLLLGVTVSLQISGQGGSLVWGE